MQALLLVLEPLLFRLYCTLFLHLLHTNKAFLFPADNSRPSLPPPVSLGAGRPIDNYPCWRERRVNNPQGASSIPSLHMRCTQKACKSQITFVQTLCTEGLKSRHSPLFLAWLQVSTTVNLTGEGCWQTAPGYDHSSVPSGSTITDCSPNSREHLDISKE